MRPRARRFRCPTRRIWRTRSAAWWRRDPQVVLKLADGSPVWDTSAYGFIDGPAPDSVNPSLWRQARLNNHHGLYKVSDGVYQVRGYDLSNMTLIEGDSGWIVVDPLTAKETAAAALDLANRNLGERPVRALIFTHSHVDHFGGVRGVLTPERARGRGSAHRRPPDFMHEATSENVLAGVAMSRRATFMYGRNLARSERGHVDSGLGKEPGLRQRGHPAADRPGGPHAPGDADRRRALRLPARARLRGAGGAHLLPARSQAPSAAPRSSPTPCTTSTPCAAPRCATR